MATSAHLECKRGFVSPKKAFKRQAGAVAAEPRQIQHPDFVYNGGPVIQSPEVYTSFWGATWSDAAHTQRVQRLNQFIQDLLNSEFMNILSQYGVGAGAGQAGRFVKSVFFANVPAQLNNGIIAQTIQAAIDAGTLPEPLSTHNNIALMIYLDEKTTVNQPGIHFCQPGQDFGFHSFFVTTARNEFYYAVAPALDDACIQTTCDGATDCSLTLSQTQEQRLTQVTSHEFTEMCTDPKLGSGWFGTTSEEAGDICNGQSGTITVGQNTWTVQCQYSKTDDENGGTICGFSTSSPMAKRSDGPR